MEPISNIQPPLQTQDASSIGGRAFAAFDNEIGQLIAMTKDEKLPLANLGTQVDIKV
jgi:hypothetical protein